jgi:transposase-like protein
MSVLSAKFFHDDAAAFGYLESVLWPEGPVCPHCGTIGRAYVLQGVKDKKGRERLGLKKCGECRKQYTVRVGTVFESAHIPLYKMLQAVYLLTSSKKGFSAHQLHRTLGITYKSAWFLAHRIREAMREGHFSGPLGGEGKTVESDETYIGGKEKNKHRSKRTQGNIGGKGKEIVLSLVERQGRVRSHHIPEVNAKTLRPILVAQIDRKSFLMTDEAGQYYHPGKEFAKHETVNHGAGEYVRGEAHSNTVENYFSILKRGITGTYHHVSQQHLKRYLAEFDFRYNERSGPGVNDQERTVRALSGIVGKRLTYHGSPRAM